MKPTSVKNLIKEVTQNLNIIDENKAELTIGEYLCNGRLTGKNSKKMMSIIDRHIKEMDEWEIGQITSIMKRDLSEKYLSTYALMDIFILEKYEMDPMIAAGMYDRMKYNKIIIDEYNGHKTIYLYDNVAMSHDGTPNNHININGIDIFYDDDLGFIDIDNIEQYKNIPEKYRRKRSSIARFICKNHRNAEYNGTIGEYIRELSDYLSDKLFKTKHRSMYDYHYMLRKMIKTKYCGSTRYIFLDMYPAISDNENEEIFIKIHAGPVELIDIPKLGPTMISKSILNIIDSKFEEGPIST